MRQRRLLAACLAVCLLMTGCQLTQAVGRGARRLVGALASDPKATLRPSPTASPAPTASHTPTPSATPQIPQVNVAQYVVVPSQWEYAPAPQDEYADLFIAIHRGKLLRTTEDLLADGCAYREAYKWHEFTFMAFTAPPSQVAGYPLNAAYLYDPKTGDPIVATAQVTGLTAGQGEALLARVKDAAYPMGWEFRWARYKRNGEEFFDITRQEAFPALSGTVSKKEIHWIDREKRDDYFAELFWDPAQPDRCVFMLSRVMNGRYIFWY